MNLDRMLPKGVSQPWAVGDLDWSLPPPELSEDDERAVVQYFTGMAGIGGRKKSFEELARGAITFTRSAYA